MSRPQIWKIDLDSLDLMEQEQLFLKAKELLRIKHDNDPDFPYEVFYNGSELLKRAANYVDGEIHNWQ